ncbi:MAG: IclR family transcriptional regulator [Rhodospirillaceae bacterium]|nr:IclR family transcriptional regulator [Rhodospirillaceae bacterium]
MNELPPNLAAAPQLDERYVVPALARGLAVLECFGAGREEQTLVELARGVGMTRSAAYRLVYTLAELGFLVRHPERKSYRLGPRVLSLGFAYLASQEMAEIARPHLEALRDRTDCSAHLAVLDGTEIVYISRCPDKKAITSRITIGTRFPAHATSMGRAILAHMPADEVRRRFGDRPMARFSDATPTNLKSLQAVLESDRARGYVLSHSNFEAGIASVAAPVFDVDGAVVAAINISTPESTITPGTLEADIKDAVVATAKTISEWLGHRRGAAPKRGRNGQ